MTRIPGDEVRARTEGLGGRVAAAEDGEGTAIERGESFGRPGPAGSMSIFVPPPIFDEEEAVLDLPVLADQFQQLVGADLAGIEARQEVARIVRAHAAIAGKDIAVHAERNLAAGEVQRLANVVGIV